MSQIPPPPPPHYPAPESSKKSTSPLVYVGIGCGALILLAVVGLFLGVGWGVKKAGNLISEVKANPEKFAAELVVKANPELELVKSDETAGEITFRDKKSGETTTLSYKDVAEGKLSVLKNGEEIVLDGTQGTVRTQGPDGETSVFGAGPSAVTLPDWFPIMEGLSLNQAGMSSIRNRRATVKTIATTNATIESIVTFYNDHLDKLGFTITRERQAAGEFASEILQAKDEAGDRKVTIAIIRADKITPVNVTFSVEGPAPAE